MGSFVFLAAILVLLALAFVVSALWQASRRLAIGLIIALPLAASLIYWLKGTPAALDPDNIAPPEHIEQAVSMLEKRLVDDPNSFEGWMYLARIQMGLKHFPKAVEAYAKAQALQPNDPDVMVEYAEAQMRAAPDQRFPPAAVVLLEKARALNPNNQRAVFFYGFYQLQNKQPAEAAQTWETLLPVLAPPAAAELRTQINQVRQSAGLPPLPDAPAAAVTASLKVRIELDPAMLSEVRPTDVLYVFAQSAEGVPGLPVAVKRLPASGFPLNITLTNADSPMPTSLLFSLAKASVRARISHSGRALPEAGDIEAEGQTIDVKDGAQVKLVLSRVMQ